MFLAKNENILNYFSKICKNGKINFLKMLQIRYKFLNFVA